VVCVCGEGQVGVRCRGLRCGWGGSEMCVVGGRWEVRYVWWQAGGSEKSGSGGCEVWCL
jgi:hypothetical protein